MQLVDSEHVSLIPSLKNSPLTTPLLVVATMDDHCRDPLFHHEVQNGDFLILSSLLLSLLEFYKYERGFTSYWLPCNTHQEATGLSWPGVWCQ